ncbi:MAG: helix-turn-helix domain-containing protein [Bryobacteraceae bacterium]|nr:helix-turn-helix domain-containing protein [Bryobacteraceae bacterium]
MIEKNGLWKEQKAAAYLDCSIKTLQGLRCRKKGPKFEKLGKMVRYRVADLEAWIADQNSGERP